MKDLLVQKVQPSSTFLADDLCINGKLGKTANESSRRRNTSAAMVWLAVSLGATGVLYVNQEDQAIAADANNPEGNSNNLDDSNSATVTEIEKLSALLAEELWLEDEEENFLEFNVNNPTQLELFKLVSLEELFSDNNQVEQVDNISLKSKEEIGDILQQREQSREVISRETVEEIDWHQGERELVNNFDPRANISIAKEAIFSEDEITQDGLRVYQVKPGDTLGDISLRYQVSLTDLITINSIDDPNLILVNQKLVIPGTGNKYSAENTSLNQLDMSRVDGEDLAKKSEFFVELSAEKPEKPELINNSVQNLSNSEKLRAELINMRQLYQNEESLNTADVNASANTRPQILSNAINNSISRVIASDRDPELPSLSSPESYLPDTYSVNINSASENSRSFNPPQTQRIENNQQIQLVNNNSIQEIESAQPTSSVSPISPNEEYLSQSFPYIDNFKEELSQLRQQYQTELNPEQTIPETEKPVAISPAEQLRLNQPDSQNDPAEPESQQEQEYAQLLQKIGEEIVEPSLPPLLSSAQYLPSIPPETAFNGYMWPARGTLTSGYGWRWGRMHRGIDIAGPIGTPIFAAAAGEVVAAGWNSSGFGNLVKLKHADGSLTLYAHNSRILVRRGQKVEQGQQIAEMGSTGFSTGPHLHFEIHPRGSGAVNPMAYLPKEKP